MSKPRRIVVVRGVIPTIGMWQVIAYYGQDDLER